MTNFLECYDVHLNKMLCYIPSEDVRKVVKDDWEILIYGSDQSLLDDFDIQSTYSEPMVWIGIYIAIVSLFCILAMVADLWHGFRDKKLWFPSKYFSLNAASITVITVSMKLPVDLSGEMPGYVDQAAKLGSLAFMCTMMANLMPSLASMDNNTLVANIIGLSILVITMIVNIGIQINTGVVNQNYFDNFGIMFDCVKVAYIYMALIFLLLIIMISSSLTNATSKEILEGKYQAINKISSFPDSSLQDSQMSMVEKLRQHVTRYWVMAETGSPQFVMASNPLSTASGVICAIVFVMNLLVVLEALAGYHSPFPDEKEYGSVYKWSILLIVMTQSVGVVVGTIAPIFRCFSVLSFKLVTNWDTNHLMVFKVEQYWTQKLYEWKESSIPFLSTRGRATTLVYNSKNLILSFCIGFQKVIVVSCKLIWFIPVVSLCFVVYCWKSFTTTWYPPPMTSHTDDNINDGLNNYVLQIHETMEFSEKTLKGISNSMNSFISKAAKMKQNNTLLKLLEKSTGFNEVQNFDTDSVQSLPCLELVNSWSLPVVTLACIAIALPNIPKEQVKWLVKSVGEGLSFTHLVEESLNSASEYVSIRKATITLWHKVENQFKWLDISLAKDAFRGKTSTEILKLFADKGEEIVTETTKSTNGELVVNPSTKLIAANSMYRIAQTLLLRHQNNTDPISEEKLFDLINDMIADIFSACFTNIPRVITTKCQESVIEKREASVKVAAKLLGKTTKIIERLESHVLPNMEPDQLAYIDDWRHYLKESIP